MCGKHFHAVWPTGTFPIEVLAVLLNSPIANAWLSQHSTGRCNPIHILNQIPIPKIESFPINLFTKLVRSYLSWREQERLSPEDAPYCASRCRGILGGIDEELLGLYGLSLRAERELLASFDGHCRPGPISLTRVKPSPTNRMWPTLLRVEKVKEEESKKIMEVFVYGFDACYPDKTIQLPLSLLPSGMRNDVVPDVSIRAIANTSTKEKNDLVFEDFELVPEVSEEFRAKFEQVA